VHGFLHPLAGIDHVLAMAAVGVSPCNSVGGMWALPLSFAATMAIAGLLGVSGLVLPGIEAGIALSVIVLGAVIRARQVAGDCCVSDGCGVRDISWLAHGLEMFSANAGVAGVGFSRPRRCCIWPASDLGC
jgi:urease accessory protein